ncbi:MAG: hypothetical protein KF856_12005 [Cyclobacteriaceae bacterium]|nr:hypothetical protein [Cyclobacteriaceae bacterium]
MKYVHIVWLTMLPNLIFGQTSIPPQMRAQFTLERLSSSQGLGPSDILYGVPMASGSVQGDVYLDKKWNKATLMPKDSEKLLEGYYVKYNLKDKTIEIKTSTGIKAVASNKIKSMVWIDSVTTLPSYFINASTYRISGTSLTGMLEVLVDAEYPLFKYHKIEIKEPTYNVAMGSGSKDTRILKRSVYFTAANSQLVQIKNIKNLSAHTSKPEKLEAFIKDQKLSIKKEKDLIEIITYLNRL